MSAEGSTGRTAGAPSGIGASTSTSARGAGANAQCQNCSWSSRASERASRGRSDEVGQVTRDAGAASDPEAGMDVRAGSQRATCCGQLHACVSSVA